MKYIELLETAIELISPEAIDFEDHKGEYIYNLLMEAARNFETLAETIPARVWCEDWTRKFLDNREDYVNDCLDRGYTYDEIFAAQYEQEFGDNSRRAREISRRPMEHRHLTAEEEEKAYRIDRVRASFNYANPYAEDFFAEVSDLEDLAETVLFVANNTTGYDNSIWDALVAGVPFEDIFA